MRPLHRRGFALPMTLFLIAIVTLLLTAAFTKVQSDRRIGDSSGARVAAMAVAKAAVQTYIGTTATRPADGDSVRINVAGGYADVIAQVIRQPADTLANWMYIVRGVGHVIDPTQGADPQAVRTIAQFAQWQTGKIDVLAALAATGGLTNSGNSVVINGADSAGCGAPTTAGIYTRSGGSPGAAAGISSITEISAGATVDTATHIDWRALIGGGFAADYISAVANDTTFSSQYYSSTGTTTLSNFRGTGLLIVAGTLNFTGVSRWSGIVLVGNQITYGVTTSDSTTIQGMVVQGLNNPGTSGVIGTQMKLRIRYNSCNVRKTLARLTGFAPITNGWVDNWATY